MTLLLSKRMWVIGLLLCFGMPAWAAKPLPPQTGAQTLAPSVGAITPSENIGLAPRRFRSPRDTIQAFLNAVNQAAQGNKHALRQAFKCFDVSIADQELFKLATDRLWDCFNHLEYFDQRNTPVPGELTIGKRDRYTYFPASRFNKKVQQLNIQSSIELVKTKSGAWKFSQETFDRIDALQRQLTQLDLVGGVTDVTATSVPLWLRSKMPTSLKGASHELVGLEYWQFIGLFATILIGVVLDYALRWVLRLLVKKVITNHEASSYDQTVHLAIRPVGLLAASMVWSLLLRAIGLPTGGEQILIGITLVFGILAATVAAWRVTDLFCEVLVDRAKKTTTKLDDVLVPLLRKSIKIFIIAMAIVYAADSFNISIMPLIMSMGVGGVAFAFAAKDTVENFFGSIAVLLDRPFEIDDWVVIGDTEGTVEEVGFRSTRIRTFYNSQVTIPNANLVRAKVDNYGRRQYRRWKAYVGVEYGTPLEKMQAFVAGIRTLVLEHPATRKDYFHVYFNQFNTSSLDILLYIFFDVPDWGAELAAREDMFMKIVALARELGVNFAFPTQTLHIANDDNARLPVHLSGLEPIGMAIDQKNNQPPKGNDGLAYT